MSARVAVAAALVAIALAGPSAAGAAYNPVVSLAFDTSAPAAAPAVTARLIQELGEDTTRTVAARFPPGISLNPRFAVKPCPGPAVESGTCPETSRIGTASVMTLYGPASGGIHLTEDFRLSLQMTALGGLVTAPVVGAIRALDDGSAEITFDGLPRVQMTEARIALHGGSRAIFLNPRRCGRYEASARFVSHGGEQVTTVLPLEITGCSDALRITSVRVSPARIGGGRRAVLAWRINRAAAATDLALFRLSGATWRQVGSVSASAAAGANRLVIRRRFGGHTLSGGTHRLVLRARGSDGTVSRGRTVRLVVAP